MNSVTFSDSRSDTQSVSPAPRTALPATLGMGPVRLRVRDAARSTAFYTGVIGLTEIGRQENIVRLGAGGTTLIELEEASDAPARTRGTTGLFHVAILLPDRTSLAVVLRRLIAHSVHVGASDHLVSEALYLDDPDGNGIEIYRDRPATDWKWDGDSVSMNTFHMDMKSVLAEAPAQLPVDAPMPAGTRIGHVHLQVGDLAQARHFYVDQLGFDVTTENYPGALFVSAGRYHHHLGLNVWHSRGGGPAPAGSIGLVHFTLVLPDRQSVEAVKDRLQAEGVHLTPLASGFLTADPWGTQVQVTFADA